MIRITADLDNIPFFIAEIRTKAIIDYLFYKKEIIFDRKIIRLSSRKSGCHVILWTRNKLHHNDIIFIRYLLGDDTKRIEKDLSRRRPKQYLFKSKKRIKKTKPMV